MGGEGRCGRVYWYLLEHEESCGMLHRIDGPFSRVFFARRGFHLPRVVSKWAHLIWGAPTGFLEVCSPHCREAAPFQGKAADTLECQLLVSVRTGCSMVATITDPFSITVRKGCSVVATITVPFLHHGYIRVALW
jgi:hypothetical protein